MERSKIHTHTHTHTHTHNTRVLLKKKKPKTKQTIKKSKQKKALTFKVVSWQEKIVKSLNDANITEKYHPKA